MLKAIVKVENPELLKKSVTIKLSPHDLEVFKKKSQEYTDGNMSAWIRYASLNHRPPKSALAE